MKAQLLRVTSPLIALAAVMCIGLDTDSTLARPRAPLSMTVIQSKSPRQLVAQGNANSAKGSLDEAASDYKLAAELDKTLAEPCLLLAETFYKLRRLDEAIANAEEAIRRRAKYPAAHALLARLYFSTGDAAITWLGRYDR